jgi:dolichol-phosphate mannosyltransferase
MVGCSKIFLISNSLLAINHRRSYIVDLVSIIVPFLNEESCIAHCCSFINVFSKHKPFSTEIIFVDDGSVDNTIDMISSYDFSYCYNVKILKLSKNFGVHAAIRAGIFHAKGDFVTYVCADLQEPDEMVSVMYDNIITGLDAVYIEKRAIQTSLINRLFSLVYSALMRRYAVKNYGSGGINNIMFNKKIKDYLNNNMELNSSLVLQVIDAGFKSRTIKMDYKNRIDGISKWTFSKKIKLFIDSFLAFSFLPVRLVSIVGGIMFVLGFLLGISIIISSFLNPDAPLGYSTLAMLLVMGFGVTNMSLGIIAEYLWRTFDAARGRPVFTVSEIKELK